MIKKFIVLVLTAAVILTSLVSQSVKCEAAELNVSAEIKEYSVPTSNSKPTFIDVDRNGNVFFSEQNSTKIGRLPASGNTIIENEVGMVTYGVKCDNDSTVYFTGGAYESPKYLALNSKTLMYKSYDTGLKAAGASDCTVNSSNYLVFNGWDSGALNIVTLASMETYLLPNFGYTSGLTQDPNGDYWLTIVQAYEMNPRLVKFSPKNAEPGTSKGFTEIPLQKTRSVIRRPIVALGKIWFSIQDTGSIGCYDPASGKFSEYKVAQGINDICVDKRGRIIFTSAAENKVGIFDPASGSSKLFGIPTPDSLLADIAYDTANDAAYFCETNGNKIGNITFGDQVPAQKPDMVVTDITYEPANPSEGDFVTFSATIKNQGNMATPFGTIQGLSFWVDGEKVTWSAYYTQSILPGQSVTITANGGGPGNTSVWKSVSGNHVVEAFADDMDRIPESDESNNKFQKNITIGSAQPGDKPDLIVEDITYTPSSLIAGTPVVFSARIKNQGNLQTPANVTHGLSFWIDDVLVAWSGYYTDSILPGQSVVLTANGAGEGGAGIWNAIVGNHKLEAFVDDVNRIPNESDEYNNKLSKSITVAP